MYRATGKNLKEKNRESHAADATFIGSVRFVKVNSRDPVGKSASATVTANRIKVSSGFILDYSGAASHD